MINNVKNWSYPFAGASGNPLANLTSLAKARGGFYPMGANGLWHGGVHFDQGTAGAFDQSSVRCIADGEVVAYRIDEQYPLSQYTSEIPLIKQAPFSTGFVLVKHRLELPPLSPTASTATPPTLTFYSLYMHLQDWAGYHANPNLPRPSFWGEEIYRVETQGSDLNVRAEASPRAAILAVLPKGTTVKAGSEDGDFRKLMSIVSGMPVPGLAPTASDGGLPGYLAAKFLKAQSEPKAKDSVVVLDLPVPIKAGELIGHLGLYQNHNQGAPQALLHLEVFSCEEVPTFIAQSRSHAARLPDAQKTLLKIHKGASKLIPHRKGIEANNPPRISDEGVTVGVDLILPQSLLDSLPADAKLVVPASTGGSSCSPELRWWRLDNLLADADGNPISGWLAEQEMITTRHSPWEWPGYDFIEDRERPAGALAYHLEALRRLTDDERTNYQGMIDQSDKGPIKQRLHDILDGNGDQKITTEEIRTALSKPWHAQSIAQLITKHESEWLWNPAKWDELDELMEHSLADPNPDWAEEKKRIETLSWWKDLGGEHGINADGVVWHFQPPALVGSFLKNSKVTTSQLKMVFQNAHIAALEELANELNKNLTAYKLDTAIRLSHFFAQVVQEVGTSYKLEESFIYSVASLKSTFSYFRKNPSEADMYGYIDPRNKGAANQIEIANRAYNGASGNRDLGNGDISSGDGWRFKGRGLKQLTGRYNYTEFNNNYHHVWPGESVDFVSNPELVSSPKYAVRSAVFFWLHNKLYDIADMGNQPAQVNAITAVINKHTDSYQARRTNFERIWTNEEIFSSL